MGADTITGSGGGAGNDQLTGNALANVLAGGPGDDVLSGGAGGDTYLFDADGALGSDLVIEAGGSSGRVDLLDFSQTTTQGITIDLGSTAQQAVNEFLLMTLSAGDAFEWVAGSTQNDLIQGNGLNNVLAGSLGDDTILGMGGRDLIVGGSGGDALNGGDDEDIIVSGTLSYFNENSRSLNRQAFEALMREWGRLDAGYATRIAHLRNGGGLNGGFRVNSGTVAADASVDTLTGGALQDWFWAFAADVATDLDDGGPETVN